MGREHRRSAVLWGSVLCWLASCGGRAAETNGSSAGQPGITSAGATSSAGSGGASSAGIASAGSSAIGVDAGPACPPCGPDMCPKGQTLDYPNSGACCSVCRDCTLEEQQAGGPPYDCGPAAHRDYPFNGCYTVCIANDPDACWAQYDEYTSNTEPVRVMYESTCQTDADCVTGFVDSACEQTCVGARPDTIAAYVAQLQKLGAACTACPPRAPQPASPCRPTLDCYNHRCVDGIPI